MYEKAYTKYTHSLRVQNDLINFGKIKGLACVEIFEDKIETVQR